MYVGTDVWTEVETVHCREKPEVRNSFQRTKVCAQLQLLAAGDTVLAFLCQGNVQPGCRCSS